MENKSIEELLLQLLQDVSFIKAKLTAIEEQRLGSRIDALEAECKEHSHTIKSLENRASTMEQFVRNSMMESKKQMTSIWVSMGLALLSAILSFIFSIF